MKTSWETPGRGSPELPSQLTQLSQLGDGYQEECPATHRDNSTEDLKCSDKMCHWFLAVPKHQVLVPGWGPVVPSGLCWVCAGRQLSRVCSLGCCRAKQTMVKDLKHMGTALSKSQAFFLLAKAAILWLRKRHCHLSSCWDAAHYPRLCLSGVTASSSRSAPCAPLLCFAFFLLFFFPGRSLVFDFCGSNSVKFLPKKFSMCFAETFLKKYRLIVIIKFPSEWFLW